MPPYTVTVDGTELEEVLDVEYEGSGFGKEGSATIEVLNKPHNRQFGSGDRMVIKNDGYTDFVGYLKGKPSRAGPRKVALQLKAAGLDGELSNIEVKRLFYDEDTGAIVRKALTTRARKTDPVWGDRGTSLGGWAGDVPVLQLGNVSSRQLSTIGNNFIFAGWPGGTGNGVYTLRSKIPSETIPGDGLLERVEFRMLINNRGRQFEGEFSVSDGRGTVYNWPMKLGLTNFDIHRFDAQEANTETEIGSPPPGDRQVMELRLKVSGLLPEPRALAIDYAQFFPFTTESRESRIGAAGIQNTGRRITRRFDTDLGQMLERLSKEDGYNYWVDRKDVLHYESGGSRPSPKEIDHNGTRVTSARFNRDFEKIENKVTVRGSDDISVTAQDSSSINYFGIQPRPADIVDKEIQTEQEARDRAEGHLRKNAWNEEAAEFEIMDTSFKQAAVGQKIRVNWPPEDINGRYTITKKETDRHGIVTIGVSKRGTV